jgi:quercetin dioxygenase-like cupin family protein
MEVMDGPEPSGLVDLPPRAYVGGARVQSVSTSLGDGLEVRFVHLEPGARSRPHVSGSGRLIHLVAGEAVVADEHGRRVVGRGETVLVGPGEWHWHGGLPHVGAVLLVVERPGDLAWGVAERDWAIGYDLPPGDGEQHGT